MSARPWVQVRLAAVLLLSAVASVGCSTDNWGGFGSGNVRPPMPGGSGRGADADLSQIDIRALLVDRIRVLPLTRIEIREGPGSAGGRAGVPRLVCHVELRDRYGHAVKGFGQLRLEMHRPGAPADEAETRGAIWIIDLIDPDQNALYYDDLITHTYQVTITELPEWVHQFAAGDSSEPWVRVRAFFRTIDREGRERVLSDDYRVQP